MSEKIFEIDFGRIYPKDNHKKQEIEGVLRFLEDYGTIEPVSLTPRYIALFHVYDSKKIKELIPPAHPMHVRKSTRIIKFLEKLHNVEQVRKVKKKDIERRPMLWKAAFMSKHKKLEHVRLNST